MVSSGSPFQYIGGSELKPFSDSSPIRQQWPKEEEEEITSIGNEQMVQLGRYFASKYVPILNNDGNDNLTGKTFWRSSKAARAKESGVSLIKGLNSFDREYISVDGDVKYGMLSFTNYYLLILSGMNERVFAYLLSYHVMFHTPYRLKLA